ncbi:MAG TPA: peptidoglycan DD-metalloendopeptidase family protein [Caulobacterales bacterium]|nr:peptidoglycan DD-metalloendopeptidase family protein [Caulobacterales bacterium]
MASGAQRLAALLACAMGALAVSHDAMAQQSSRARLAQVERDRTAASAEAARLRRQGEAARAEIASLNNRLVEAGRRRAASEAALADAEQRLAALRAQADIDAARYARDRAAFESALITAALAERRMDLPAVRAGQVAGAAAPVLHADLAATAQALANARRRDAEIAEEERALADAQQAIDAERADVIVLLNQRRALRASLDADAEAAERRVRQLAREARNLRELTERLAAAQQRRGAARSAAEPLPASWILPASGRITRAFGVRVAGGPPSQGVTITTRPGAQVLAPANGRVAYAGVFRSYGQVLILNLDGGYAIVFTGLGAVRAQHGEGVLAGQPIGEMTVSDTAAPELYVEVRRDGRPVDPARWLSARGLASEPSGRSPG